MKCSRKRTTAQVAHTKGISLLFWCLLFRFPLEVPSGSALGQPYLNFGFPWFVAVHSGRNKAVWEVSREACESSEGAKVQKTPKQSFSRWHRCASSKGSLKEIQCSAKINWHQDLAAKVVVGKSTIGKDRPWLLCKCPSPAFPVFCCVSFPVKKDFILARPLLE